MKRQVRILALTASALMAGCSLLPGNNTSHMNSSMSTGAEPARSGHAAEASAYRVIVEDREGRVEVEKVTFRSGVSSASVEQLAKQSGCAGGNGAALLTAKGPVEVYRMQCDDGTVFMARCELRQCRTMR